MGNLWTASGTLLVHRDIHAANRPQAGSKRRCLRRFKSRLARCTSCRTTRTSGFYAGSDNYFTPTSVDNGPLHAPQDGTEGGGNGVYNYGSNVFPNQTFNGANYWVDVVFITSVGPDTTPPDVNGTAPANGSSSTASNTAVTATFNEERDECLQCDV